MTFGQKIANLRNQKEWSQEDLAYKLSVSRQTIYKWENDIVFPTKENLNDLTRILETSYDYLLGDDTSLKSNQFLNDKIDTDNIESKDKDINKDPKPLYICWNCSRYIYDEKDAIKIKINKINYSNNSNNKYVIKEKPLCQNCYNKYKRKKENIEIEKGEIRDYFVKHRFSENFIFGILEALLILSIGIPCIFLDSTNKTLWICFSVIGSIYAYTFTGCIILYNNIVVELFLKVASKGFVKMPRIIFSSIKDLIVAKIILCFFSYIIAILATTLALIVSFFISLFVYPYALYKSINYPYNTYKFDY